MGDYTDPNRLDADLRGELEKIIKNPRSHTADRWRIFEKQDRRDKRKGMKPIERRLDVYRENIADARKKLGSDTVALPFPTADIRHMHVGLALCGLPYKKPQNDKANYVREYGRNSLAVQPGFLKNPHTGKMEEQGVPYGAKARLILLYVCSKALKEKSPTITLPDSLSEFLDELGFPRTGGERGTLKPFKEQMQRVFSARYVLGFWDGERAITKPQELADEYEIWTPTSADQPMLWRTKLTLSPRFYESLTKHALPVNIKALQLFQHSARQMDVIMWLAYRVRAVSSPLHITWEQLFQQFSGAAPKPTGTKQQQAALRAFRRDFGRDIEAIQKAFPNLPLAVSQHGLRISPLHSDPELVFVPPKRRLAPTG
jgi:hypothetical protein